MNYSIGWTSSASEFQSSRVTTMCVFFLIQTKRTNTLSFKSKLGGGFKYFLFSLRPLGKFIPFWLYNIFHKCVGWNHQPEKCPSGFSRRKKTKNQQLSPWMKHPWLVAVLRSLWGAFQQCCARCWGISGDLWEENFSKRTVFPIPCNVWYFLPTFTIKIDQM